MDENDCVIDVLEKGGYIYNILYDGILVKKDADTGNIINVCSVSPAMIKNLYASFCKKPPRIVLRQIYKCNKR